MPDDPATPSTPLGDPGRITPPSPARPGEAATPQTAVAPPDTRPAARVLYVQGAPDLALTAYINWYLNYNFGGAGRDVVIAQALSWADFVKLLQSYSSVDQLFILAHAFGSSIQFGHDLLDASEMATKLGEAGNIPKVGKRIAVEGCTAGFDPPGLLKLARFFGAQKITASNFYHGVSIQTLIEDPPFTAEADARAKLTQALGVWEPYFLPGTPPASSLAASAAPGLLAEGSQTMSVPVEWFSQVYVGDDDRLPADPAARGTTYRPRSQAEDKVVRTDEEAESLGRELERWSFVSSQPHPFYQVVAEPMY